MTDYSANLIVAQQALKRCSEAAAERDYETAWREAWIARNATYELANLLDKLRPPRKKKTDISE